MQKADKVKSRLNYAVDGSAASIDRSRQQALQSKGARKELSVLLVTGLCCAVLFASRLLISPTMDLDEAEQYSDAASLSWGYPREAPLFSWCVWLVGQVIGLSPFTILLVKYLSVFLFIFAFNKALRLYFARLDAKVITYTVTFSFLFLYEFNRHYTHSIQVTAFGALTLYALLKLVKKPKMRGYFLLGTSVGLGLLSKYNYPIVLLGYFFSSLFSKELRRPLLNRYIIISIVLAVAIAGPHLVWLVQNDFLPLADVAKRAKIGISGPSSLKLISDGFADLFLYFVLFSIGIGFRYGQSENRPETNYLGYLCFFSLILPCLFVLATGSGEFSAKWLAPVFILFPIWLFLANSESALSPKSKRFYSKLSLSLISLYFIAKLIIGIGPTITGKVKRTHYNFKESAAELKELFKEAEVDIKTTPSLFLSHKLYIPSNISYHLHQAGYSSVRTELLTERTQRSDLQTVVFWADKKKLKPVPELYRNQLGEIKQIGEITAPVFYCSKCSPLRIGVGIPRG